VNLGALFMTTTNPEAQKPLTKAAFILSLPHDLPASKAVEQAIAAGYPNTKAAHVHEIRSAARRGPRKRPGSNPSKNGLSKPVAPAPASKTAFILSQPVTIGPSEVVKLGKEAGFVFTSAYVSKIRWEARKTAKKKTPSKKQAASKPIKVTKPTSTPKPSTKTTLTRSDFIRSQPEKMTTSEVVAAGSKAGLMMTPRLVRLVRLRARKASGAAVAQMRAGRPSKKPVVATKKVAKIKTPATAPVVVSNEVAFRKLVLDLGLERAKGLLAEVEKKIAEVIAGK
jgi:hypothetical protein